MNIVFFAHPKLIGSQSMPRYSKWLAEGMENLGHRVTIWSPIAFFFNLPVPQRLKKWMGYIDQYIIFPLWVKREIKNQSDDTLYVFTDHALGPWVPLVKNKPNIVHCHDFLAQKSSLGQIPQNSTGLTGKIYQEYIRKGFSKSKNFISISKKTREDLHELIEFNPQISEVVYNGLTSTFTRSGDLKKIRGTVSRLLHINLDAGYILHVGGNQWYKNRLGVIELYIAWRSITNSKLPLLMVGSDPTNLLRHAKHESIYKCDIHFLVGKSDEMVKNLYQGASIFLFPSFAEGFGWPIIEAMASGVPVITTNEAPMTEVGGEAAIYIDKKPFEKTGTSSIWADKAALIIEKYLHAESHVNNTIVENGLQNINRFKAEDALKKIEKIYHNILLINRIT